MKNVFSNLNGAMQILSSVASMQEELYRKTQPLASFAASMSQIPPLQSYAIESSQVMQSLAQIGNAFEPYQAQLQRLTMTPAFSAITDLVQQMELEQQYFSQLTLSDTLQSISSIFDAEELAYLKEQASRDGFNSNVEIPTETVQILQEELADAFANQQNWQQKVHGLFLRYKEKNPVIAYIILAFITYLLTTFIYPSCIGLAKDLIVRVAPNSSAKIVCRTLEGQEAFIVGDVPHYYEIELTDPETGNTIPGYISKRSITVLQKQEDTTDANT